MFTKRTKIEGYPQRPMEYLTWDGETRIQWKLTNRVELDLEGFIEADEVHELAEKLGFKRYVTVSHYYRHKEDGSERFDNTYLVWKR